MSLEWIFAKIFVCVHTHMYTREYSSEYKYMRAMAHEWRTMPGVYSFVCYSFDIDTLTEHIDTPSKHIKINKI